MRFMEKKYDSGNSALQQDKQAQEWFLSVKTFNLLSFLTVKK